MDTLLVNRCGSFDAARLGRCTVGWLGLLAAFLLLASPSRAERNSGLSGAGVLEDYLAQSDPLPGLTCSVLRFELDVTGDDLAEVFLTDTQSGGAAGNDWTVYSPTQTGYSRLGRIFFHPAAFRVQPEAGLLITWHSSDAASGSLGRYLFRSGSIEALGFESMEAGTPEFAEATGGIRDWQLEAGPALEQTPCGALQQPGPEFSRSSAQTPPRQPAAGTLHPAALGRTARRGNADTLAGL